MSRDPAAAIGAARTIGVRDVAVAAAVWLLAVATLTALPMLGAAEPDAGLLVPPPGSPVWWTTLATVTAQAAAVAVARARPVTGVVAVSVVTVPLSLVGSSSLYSVTSLGVLVGVYVAVASHERADPRFWLPVTAAVLIVGSAVAGALETGGFSPSVVLAAVLQGVLLVFAPAGIATVVRSRRETRRAREGEVRALARERDALVQAAIDRERTAMARELHDIAAHHLSGIAVMASAIEKQIDSAPERAKEGAREVREQSRAVLRDLRRLVGLLRDEGGAETGVRSLAAIPDLVAGFPGAEVELERQPKGTTTVGAGLGPGAQLAGYRTVQEALTNAARHAPGASCTVVIDDRGDEEMLLRVRNGPSAQPPRDPGGGLGLRGMRERAELVGGVLRYGPTLDGGWEVVLRLPRGVPAETAPGPEGDVREGERE